MKLTPLALFALTMPATSAAWMMDRSPFFSYELMRPSVSPMKILREQQALANRIANEWNCRTRATMLTNKPRFQLKDELDKFEVSIDLPGISSKDVTVSFEDDNNILSIAGRREYSTERGAYSERFSQSFYLDPSVDTAKISANLDKGVLVVSAPKADKKRLESNIRTIPIHAPPGNAIDEVSENNDAKENTAWLESRKVNAFEKDQNEAKPANDEDDAETLDLDSNEDF